MNEVPKEFRKDDGGALQSSDLLSEIPIKDRYVGTVLATDDDGDDLAWTVIGSPAMFEVVTADPQVANSQDGNGFKGYVILRGDVTWGAYKRYLDYESFQDADDEFSVLFAEVSDADGGSAKKRMFIHLQDLNDNPPYFCNLDATPSSSVCTGAADQYAFDLSENHGVDSIVTDAIFIAEDLDAKSSGGSSLTFELENADTVPFKLAATATYGKITNSAEKFGLRYSITLTLTEKLDYDGSNPTRTYTVKVKVSDCANVCRNSKSATLWYVITVTDFNDNKPVFEGDYSTNVQEGPGVKVDDNINIVVKATDADPSDASHTSGTISYSVLDSSRTKASDIVGVKDDGSGGGQLYMKKALDFEASDLPLDKSIVVYVRATDGGGLTADVDSKVTLFVTDYNDQVPIWSGSTNTARSAFIDEEVAANTYLEGSNGVRFAVLATDADTADTPRSLVQYFISDENGDPASNNYFKITDVKRGEFVFIGNANYQLESDGAGGVATIEFYVMAKDSADDSSVNEPVKEVAAPLLVRVSVLDTNDNAPVFTDQSKSFANTKIAIEESSADNQLVATLYALDADSGANNKAIAFSFSFFGRSDVLEGTTNVVESNMNPFTLTEVGSGGAVEIRVNAKNVDHEEVTFFVVEIQASDKGSPSKSATLRFVVDVTDKNEHAPVFVGTPYSKTIKETVATGTIVAELDATDADATGTTISYALADDNDGFFELVGNAVKTAKAFQYDTVGDAEGRTAFELTVTATDSGSAADSSNTKSTATTIAVEITNVDDETPAFTKDDYGKVTLVEGTYTNKEIVEVDATDADGSGMGNLAYSISSTGGFDSMFKMSGRKLLLSGDLDFDGDEPKSYTITMKVVDSAGAYDTCTVSLTITNINDNKPVWPASEDHFYISDSLDVGEKVGEVKATDKDGSDVHGTIQYRQPSDSRKRPEFYVTKSGNNAGLIALAQTLDDLGGDQNVEYYELTVIAYNVDDSGDEVTSQLSDERVVKFTLISENSLKPSFQQKSYTATPDEDVVADGLFWKQVNEADFTARELPSLTLLAIQGLAKGSNVNWEIETYAIESGNDDGVFELDFSDAHINKKSQRTCKVNAVKPLDHEVVKEYTLKIVATDTEKRESNPTTLTISVGDKNDNAPIFASDSATKKEIKEDAVRGTEIATFEATDLDITKSGDTSRKIFYKITAGDDTGLFTIKDTHVGTVTVAAGTEAQGKLDRDENYPSGGYTLTISALDAAEGGREDKHQINVVLTDINDNAPVFDDDNAGYECALKETASQGTVCKDSEGNDILVDRAVDIDEGDNKKLTYAFWGSGIAANYIDIDEDTGALKVKSGSMPLPLSVDNTFTAYIIATDGGDPPRDDETSVKVTVEAFNRHPPHFALSKHL